MSRIGKKPVTIPSGVDIKVDNGGKTVVIKGPKGTLTQVLGGAVVAAVDTAAKELRVTNDSEERQDRAMHGLYRALLANMIVGVTTGYQKSLEIQGVGYRAQLKGKKLELFVGYNTKIPEVYQIPDGVTVTVPTPTEINVVGIDKQLVGQVAASIRLVRKPDVYKGKGVRYRGEVVRKLPGKTVAATGK